MSTDPVSGAGEPGKESPYQERFKTDDAVAGYSQLYDPGTRDSLVWELQRPVLASWIEKAVDGRHDTTLLDFACGTGRILRHVAPFVDEATGVDISEAMVASARSSKPFLDVRVGDLLSSDPSDAEYDVITAFRFLLNVEPSVRAEVFARFREKLLPRDGLLIFNNHGHSRSLRQIGFRTTGARWSMRNQLSERDIRALLRLSGFRLIDRWGVGLLPGWFYRGALRTPAGRIDEWTAGRGPFEYFAMDVLYAARPYL